MKKGFSLVELMVTITIVGIMVSFGVSAYARGRDRQEGRAAGEQIIGFLTENQKKANIGDEDCSGSIKGTYTGQSITFSGTTITATSSCSIASGTPESITIAGISSMTGSPIKFKPLSQGTLLNNLPSTSSIDIDYMTTSGTSFRVQVTSTGTIEYKGAQ